MKEGSIYLDQKWSISAVLNEDGTITLNVLAVDADLTILTGIKANHKSWSGQFSKYKIETKINNKPE